MTTRRIVVVRHGQTEANRQGIWQGHQDTELSAIGLDQAAAAAPELAAYDPVVIVSSDLRRAAVTAEAVAALSGAPLVLDPRLREVDVGQWQAMATTTVRERFPDVLAAMERGEDVRRGVTGETLAELAARVGAVVAGVTADLPAGRTAILVTHGVAGRTTVATMIGLDPIAAAAMLRGLDNCHWADVVESASIYGASTAVAWRLARWNATTAAATH